MPLPLLWPAAIVQTPLAPKNQKPLPRAEAEFRLLEAFDEGLPLPMVKVAPGDRPALLWLRQAAQEPIPKNPFPKGSKPFKEVQALLNLVHSTPERWDARLEQQSLALTGTQLVVWKWGRSQVQAGRMTPSQRRAWEDRLLPSQSPILKGYALRHALCWALSEGDEERFRVLKGLYADQAQGTFSAFQNLFGWLGGTTSRFRLWKLPSLTYEDLRLDEVKGARLWIGPADAVLPAIPDGTDWIIPTREGRTGAGEASLSLSDLSEGKALAARLKDTRFRTWLAPQRQAWEASGLAFFPILIEFDETHRIRRIRMGDAAPATP